MKHNSVVYSICSDDSSYLKLMDQESVIVRGVRECLEQTGRRESTEGKELGLCMMKPI